MDVISAALENSLGVPNEGFDVGEMLEDRSRDNQVGLSIAEWDVLHDICDESLVYVPIVT